MSFQISFRQRMESQYYPQSFSSVGQNWFSPWLSAVNSWNYWHYGLFESFHLLYNGTDRLFNHPEQIATNYFTSDKLLALTNSSGVLTYFEVLHPDGAVDVYGFRPTNSSGNGDFHYLTQRIDPQGHVTQFIYDGYDPNNALSAIRLRYVVDANGGTNTLTYAPADYATNLLTGGTNLVIQVTDPYGRSAHLAYDQHGLLTNITDSMNLSSTIIYDDHGWPTNLHTPYGTTIFEPFDWSFVAQYDRDRSIVITMPNNGVHVYEFLQGAPYEPQTIPSSVIPTNTPVGTLSTNVLATIS
jgi:YD repeat-containing protein